MDEGGRTAGEQCEVLGLGSGIMHGAVLFKKGGLAAGRRWDGSDRSWTKRIAYALDG